MMVMLETMAVRGTVLLALMFVALGLLRRGPAAMRHLVVLSGLVAAIALPGLYAVMPGWRILPGPVKRAAAEQIVGRSGAPREGSVVFRPEAASVGMESVKVGVWIEVIYGAGAAVVLLRMGVALVALAGLRRRERRIEGASWNRSSDDVRARLGVRRTVVLLEAPGAAAMPMTWGVVSPCVLIPQEGARWSEECRRLVLLHEMAHVKRWDAAWQVLGQVACALYWFHPLAWLAVRQLRAEADIACDDLVVRGIRDSKASTYAEGLLMIARGLKVTGFTAVAATAMARGSRTGIEGRIRRILDGARDRRGISRLAAAAVVAVAVCALVAVTVCRAEEGGSSASSSQAAPAGDFSHVVPFKLGAQQLYGGDELTITDIRSDTEQFALGHVYEIRGTYRLASSPRAGLATYVTAPSTDGHHDPYDPRQTMMVDKGSGTFSVVLPYLSKGYPHVSFYPMGTESSTTTVYFGGGEAMVMAGGKEHRAVASAAASSQASAAPESAERYVYIMGSVTRAGVYQLSRKPLDVRMLLASAGFDANMREALVTVIRRTGANQETRVLKNVRAGTVIDGANNPMLQGNDVVVVTKEAVGGGATTGP